jgi:hypothetical protein
MSNPNWQALGHQLARMTGAMVLGTVVLMAFADNRWDGPED